MINAEFIIINKMDDIHNMSFVTQDIYGIMKEHGMEDYAMLELDPYKFDNKTDKIINELNELRKKAISKFIIVTMDAYVSTREFPKGKYYCEAMDGKDCYKEGKIELPLDKIIDRQIKVIEPAGFVNINKYCNLEFSEPFVWAGNEPGKKLIDILTKEKLI